MLRPSCWHPQPERLFLQAGEMRAQCLLIDKTEVVHRAIGFGRVFCETGDAHHELITAEAEAFFQGQIAIDVLAKLAGLAFDQQRQCFIASAQHEDVQFVHIVVSERQFETARRRITPALFMRVAQAHHQCIPLQPFAIEEITGHRRSLQHQAQGFLFAIVQAFRQQREVVQLATDLETMLKRYLRAEG